MSVTVVHSLPTWLPLTATWLYALIRNQPDDIACHVACGTIAGGDRFPLANVHALRDASRVRWLAEALARKSRLRAWSPHLVRTARRHGAAVIHSHWGDVAWRDLGAVHRAGCRHVATFYGKDVNYLPVRFPAWRRRYVELFASVDAVLCEGPHMGRCLAALGCDPAKIVVNSLGIDVDRFRYEPRRWRPDEELRFLIAASFREKKGIPDGLEAIAAACGDRPFAITIIGDASSDARSQPEKQRILATIDRLGIASRTRLMGYQPYDVLLREAYAHHVFVSPSVTAADGDTEGGAPVTLIEMAATGMPILSTTHCDIPHVIEDGIGGFLAPERDVAALTANLRRYLDHPEEWEALTRRARRRIEAEFEVKRQSQRVAEVYRALAGGAAPPGVARSTASPSIASP